MNNNIAIIITGVLIAGAIMFSGSKKEEISARSIVPKASIENGVQVVSIMAKAGYAPRVTEAAANIPMKLLIKTQETYDCSSSLVIRAIGYEGHLQPDGETTINVPPQKAGTTLRATCGMGMYSFTVNFS